MHTTVNRSSRRLRVAAVAAAAISSATLALSPATAVAQGGFGDGFGLVPGEFFAATCNLPAIDPVNDAPDVQLEKRDCHPASSLAPQTAEDVTQAGAHPDATTSFVINPAQCTDRGTDPDGDGPRPSPCLAGADPPSPDGNAKDVVIDLPPGLIGDPEAAPKCPQGAVVYGDCPVGSQVGIVDLRLSSVRTAGNGNPNGCGSQPSRTTFPQFSVPPEWPAGINGCRFPIFNLAPARGQVAAFGFNYFSGISIIFVPTVRTDGDYGLTMTAKDVPQSLRLSKSVLTFWGVPGDPKHDAFRFNPNAALSRNRPPGQPWPSELPVKPFISNPTSCDGQQPVTTIRANSWEDPEIVHADEMHSPPVTGCDRVPFAPQISLQPTSSMADSASGLKVDISLPQTSDPDVLATAHLDKVDVTLAEGATINPSGADGLQGCTDEQLGLHSKAEVTCPEASKIGSVAFDTPVLPHPGGPGTPNLTGDVYLGQPLSTNPESGDMFRLFLVGRNVERGLLVKLKGSVVANAQTGRLSTTFDDNPQVPVSRIQLELKGGERGLLAMPQSCGTHTSTARLTPWTESGGGHAVDRVSSFTVSADGLGGGCPAAWPFAPGFSAGMSPAAGGGMGGAFSMTIDRPERQQEINGLTVVLPPGLLGKIAGVPLCGDGDANAGTCPAASRVGTATVAAGVGKPFSLAGPVALTGPYKGGPYGLAVAVRVLAGPFDLGTVVVRQAIHVDPTDAHLTVVSDPLPTIVGGVPVRLRTIGVDIDRPGFMVNPTSCAEKQITATLQSTQGATAPVGSRFQVNGCAALPFEPRMTMRLSGRKEVKDGRHPGLEAVVTQQPGEANLKSATVRLPLRLALDPDNAQSLCEFEAGKRGDCPATSIIGHATAVTPLLNRPLTGPVYFVKNVRIHPVTGRPIRTLPTLFIPLRGEIALDLRATTDVERSKLVNTFPLVPDAQISRFELKLDGGKNGVIVVTGGPGKNLCQGKQVAEVDLDGQNGKRRDFNAHMKTPCAKRKKAGLKITKARWRGGRLKVSGRIARAAKERVKVTAGCGKRKSTATKRVKPKRGRWQATLKVRKRCANARRVKVGARYAGGLRVKQAGATRRVKHRR